ncbi:hypothetical protein, partial [Holdemania filiformis]
RKQENTGYFLISFCLGNSAFPLGHSLTGNVEFKSQLFLRKPDFFSSFLKLLRKIHACSPTLHC